MYSLPDAAGFEQTQAQVRVSRTLDTSCSSLPDAYYICDKIKQTMPPSIHRLISLARAKDWEDFKGLWVPEDFRIEGCRVLAGMRSTCTLIEDDGLWFEGSDGSQLFVSVRLGRECVRWQVKS